jgi:uncharacterized membrane protein
MDYNVNYFQGGGRNYMRYTEIEHYSKGQVLEGSYKEVIENNAVKADSFIHTITFYKLFYIFVIGSIFGCYMEQIQYLILRGIWECRAGVVWGPFSEIYGLGAGIIYLLYVKLKGRSPLLIFSLSAVCGSAFEYIARVFQEIAFHSITWDYSKEPLNLSGRTSLKYAIYWGLLGLVFIKAVFPVIDGKLEKIRGRMAFAFTWVLIVFMSANLMFSALAVNRWNERQQGLSSEGYIEEFMDNHYHDNHMKQRFPHMKFMDVSVKIS